MLLLFIYDIYIYLNNDFSYRFGANNELIDFSHKSEAENDIIKMIQVLHISL